VPNSPDEKIEILNSSLDQWQQGDCLLGDYFFLLPIDKALPLSSEAQDAARQGFDLAETDEIGLCVISQTCDVVRDCLDRPYINVAPLMPVDDSSYQDIVKMRRPNYVAVPGLATQKIVVDLDRIMTVEKSILGKSERVEGCKTDMERRRFADSLMRKLGRPAFPDEFVNLVSKLKDRLSEKHGKASPEGIVLRSLREIRIQASPDWNADQIELLFYFVKDPEAEQDSNDVKWEDYRKQWLKFIEPTERFLKVNGVVVELCDINAQEYLDSDPLDLDHLSSRQE
jgi:hypothetical protein